jgi:anti-anti-sigma factor
MSRDRDESNGCESPAVIALQPGRFDIATSGVVVRVRSSGRWKVLVVEGEMDLLARSLAPSLWAEEPVHVVVDLRGVTFMDAGGLGVLVGGRHTAVRSGGELLLVAPSGPVRRVLAITGMDAVFTTFDSVDAALSAPISSDPGPVGVSGD